MLLSKVVHIPTEIRLNYDYRLSRLDSITELSEESPRKLLECLYIRFPARLPVNWTFRLTADLMNRS